MDSESSSSSEEMASTMVRAINGGGAFVTLRTYGHTTFIRIDIADGSEDCSQSKSCSEHYFQNFVNNPFSIMTKSKGMNDELSTRKGLLTVGLIFMLSSTALFYVYTSFPDLKPEEKQYLKLPLDIEDAKNLGKLLESYKDLYYIQVLTGLFVTYIFLQTFAIPGSIFLSILSGFLFPFTLALTLVCTCSAIGASLCYLLSSLVGRRLIRKYFPDKAKTWSEAVHKHKDNLLSYMLFLRITPLLPNWFINLASPVVGVPMWPFTLGTFLGVAPPSFVAIQAGQTLNKLTSSTDAFSLNSIILLIVFALLSLVPVVFKRQIREKFE